MKGVSAGGVCQHEGCVSMRGVSVKGVCQQEGVSGGWLSNA